MRTRALLLERVGEKFNGLQCVNRANTNATSTTCQSGVIQTADDARIIQLGLIPIF